MFFLSFKLERAVAVLMRRRHDFAMGNQAGVQIRYEALAGTDIAE